MTKPLSKEQLSQLLIEVLNGLADDLGLPALPAPWGGRGV